MSRHYGELAAIYMTIFIIRLGSGANLFLLSYLSPGSEIAVGVVLAVYPLAEALTSLAAGQLADRIGRRVTLLAGFTWLMIFITLIFMVLSRGGGVADLIVVNGLMGLGAALVLVSSLAIIVDLTRRDVRGLGMGFFDFLNIFGYALGYQVGSILYQYFNSATSYVPLILTLLPFYVASIIFVRETMPVRGGVVYSNPLRGIPRRVQATLPIWFSITTILGAALYTGRVLGKLHVMPIQVGSLVLGATLVVGLGSVAFGRLSDRLGRVRVMRIGIAGVSIGLVVLTVALMLGLNPIYSVAIASPFIFLASAVVPSILALTGDEALLTMRGSSMGLYSLMLGLGMSIGSVLASLAYTHAGLGGIALAALVIFALALIAYVAMSRA